ncbi:MAG: tetratricopeptide repeat protein [Candidatus Aminicenantes bacterium]|nr:MAG: tetratricopeptide repeat protein [Candidatus Aminicenantes bacterium]
MKTKIKHNVLSIYCVLCVVLFSAFALHSQGISPTLKEIEELYTKARYSLVLEKSLDILNTKEDRLTPLEAAFLHYYIAMAYKKNHNHEIASDYFKKITLKYPGSDYAKSAYLELADIFKDDYFQQEAYLEKLFAGFPDTPEAVRAGIELSKGYLQLKNFRKALTIMETIVNLWKKGEENPELYILMAVGYSGIKDYLEAIDYLRKAEKTIKPAIESNPYYLFEAGKILHNNLNFRRAIDYLERLFNVYPKYKGIPGAANLLALCYEREDKLFLSAVFLIKAIEKNPPKNHLYTLFLNLGRILGKLEEEEFKKIKRSYPLYSDAQKLLTYVKNNSLDSQQQRTAALLLSDEFKKSDNMEMVVDNFYKFLKEKRDPLVEKLFRQNLDNYLYDLDKEENDQQVFKVWVKVKSRKSYLSAENLLRFGEILSRMKLFANAEEIYRHLLKYRMFAQHWPPARKRLIRILFQLGRYEECIRHTRQLTPGSQAEKNEFNYYKIFSLGQLKKGNEVKNLLDSGAADFDEITDIFQYRISLFKAEHLEKEKKYHEALDIYQQMIRFKQVPREDEGCLLVSIADLYYELNDLESSLSYYRLAEKANINMEWVLFRMIKILRELNKRSEAEKELEKLKKINPGSFWVRQLNKDV